MKSSFIALLTFLSYLCCAQSILYLGAIKDTLTINPDCSNKYYYKIDGSTLAIPDRFYILNNNKDTIFDTKFIPCDTIFANGLPCNTGFLHFKYGQVSFYDSLPQYWPFQANTEPSGSFRLEFVSSGKIEIYYIGNPQFPSTIAKIFIYKKHIRDTVFVDKTYYECQDIISFSSGLCQDTIFNYNILNEDFGGEYNVCQGDFITLDSGVTYITNNDFIDPYTILCTNTDTILAIKDYGVCQTTDTIFLNVTKPDLSEGDTIFLKKNEPMPTGYNNGVITIEKDSCTFSLNVYLKRLSKGQFYIPNAFSPNGDGINDVFRIPDCDYIKSIERMVITDRWGNIVSNRNYWDGEKYQNGTYTGRVVFINAFGEYEEHYFTINLLR